MACITCEFPIIIIPIAPIISIFIRGPYRYRHDDVIKWKHFPRYWPFVRGIHRSRWIPRTKASNAEPWCFLRLNKRLSKQTRGWWFEPPSWSLWRQCNGKVFYRKISLSLKGARWIVKMSISLSNLVGVSAAMLPRRLPNFKATGNV